MSITLEVAQSEDIPEVLSMMEAFYAIDHYPFDAALSRKNLKLLMEDVRLGRLFLIQEDKTIFGYIILAFGFSFEYGGRDAFIDEFFLKPEFRGKGIGEQTLEIAEKEAASLGVRALHLEVENHNVSAHQLYIRRGFSGNHRSLLTKKI